MSSHTRYALQHIAARGPLQRHLARWAAVNAALEAGDATVLRRKVKLKVQARPGHPQARPSHPPRDLTPGEIILVGLVVALCRSGT